jgi:hypothetical protein
MSVIEIPQEDVTTKTAGSEAPLPLAPLPLLHDGRGSLLNSRPVKV